MKLRGMLAGLGVMILAGCGGQAAAPPTVTVTAAAPPARTVMSPTTVPGPTTTVTATTTLAVTATAAAPPAGGAGGGGGAGPFADGTYLVGSEVAAGNYKCNAADGDTRWIIEDSAGETLDIDFSSVARVPANGYTVQFKACSGQWERVGG